jgi:4,5:9,10-diseco-3-hydroxy-5,9,17-trioxoandrosta-1(10),2-diene-4-oate hydrolase
LAPEAALTTQRLRASGDALYRAAGIEVEHHEDEVAGLRTHWVTAGHTDSPHAVLLHGSGGSAALWYPTLAALAARRHVVAVDMPGHGETSIPAWPSPGTMDRMLGWLAEFLDRFEWPLLVGHSLGGYMALLHFARLRPTVAGLVLVDAGGVGPRPPGFVMATRHPVLGGLLGLAAGARPTRRRMERTIRRLTVDPYRIPHGQLALDYALETASRPGAGRFQFEVYRSVAIHEAEPGYKVWGRMHEISSPTLLVWGERDYFPLRYAQQAAREMPAARLEVLPQTGHLAYLEDPQTFNEVLGGWIQATYEK